MKITEKIKNIKPSRIRAVFLSLAFLIAAAVIVLLLCYKDGFPTYMAQFIKDLTGGAVLAFALSLGTYFFEKKKD